MLDNAIYASLSKSPPSAQNAIDIFRGSWKAALPPELQLAAGDNEVFPIDPRVTWADPIIGGFRGKSVLELGPFEAYDTRLFQMLGAASIVAVEANNINYLKCLTLKENTGLKASFLYGEFVQYLQSPSTPKADIIWASGVLYHSTQPLELLSAASKLTDRLFIWTHVYNPRHLSAAGYFDQARDVQVEVDGAVATYRYRSYRHPVEPGDLPVHYEGGVETYANWITRDELLAALKCYGYATIHIHQEGDFADMDYIGLLATR